MDTFASSISVGDLSSLFLRSDAALYLEQIKVVYEVKVFIFELKKLSLVVLVLLDIAIELLDLIINL